MTLIPQQRQLMGSSAQNSSGVHWCRRRFRRRWFRRRCERQVRFNRVLEKVPEKVPEKVWEALVQAPGQVQRGSGEGVRDRSGSTGFRRWFRRRSGRLWSRLRCFQRLVSRHTSEIFVKNKTLGLLMTPPKLI